VISPSQIVLLAAGMGTRLGELGGGMPKALFDAAGRRLIDRALAFAGLLGGERIVVGGFQHERLAAHLAAQVGPRDGVRLLENTRYRAGNLLTLVTALPELTGSVLVMNIDHVYRPAVAERIREQAGDHVTAFVDFDRTLAADDMKVALDVTATPARVRGISKQLASWDCGYVGMTFIPAARLARYRQAIADVQAAAGEAAHVEQVLQRLADDGEPVVIGDISGIGWYELDTPEDVAKALPELERLTEPSS
jgi:L-glutamine-phosphate cytidylyltransferase